MGVSRVDVGDRTLIDLTGDSVNPQSLLKGVTAHGKDGEIIEGTLDLSSSRTLTSISVTAPVKDTYEVGETLDLSGITVTANYKSTEDVTQSAVFAPVDGQELTQAGMVTISVSYTEGGVTKTAETSVTVTPALEIVTWADGTDEQIAAMLEAHYAGDINIHDYWHVGDERVVHLSAIGKGAVEETHVAQDVTMVLLNAGGKSLYPTINGVNRCAFIVGQKNCLLETGYMNPTNTSIGGWSDCKRRIWCNETYRNSLPSTLKPIFKQYFNQSKRIAAAGQSSSTEQTLDYFALETETEIFGTINWSSDDYNEQFAHYKTRSNRVKKQGESGSACTYFERSASIDGKNDSFCAVTAPADMGKGYSSLKYGIAPFGCI